MIAVVVGRSSTERSAARLADRFARAHGQKYGVERIARSDFTTHPFAVVLHVADDSEAVFASLESYDCDE